MPFWGLQMLGLIFFFFCFTITLLCSLLPTLLVLFSFGVFPLIILSSFNLSIYGYLVVNPPPPLPLKIFSHIESILKFSLQKTIIT